MPTRGPQGGVAAHAGLFATAAAVWAVRSRAMLETEAGRLDWLPPSLLRAELAAAVHTGGDDARSRMGHADTRPFQLRKVFQPPFHRAPGVHGVQPVDRPGTAGQRGSLHQPPASMRALRSALPCLRPKSSRPGLARPGSSPRVTGTPQHIHLVAVCGTGTGSLAILLKTLGHHVTGSDRHVYPPMSTQLQQWGIPVREGFRAAHLQPCPDLVIVGNAISRGNPEGRGGAGCRGARDVVPAGPGAFPHRRPPRRRGGGHARQEHHHRADRLDAGPRRSAAGLFCRRRDAEFSRPHPAGHRSHTWWWRETSTTAPTSTKAPSFSITGPERRC